VFNLNNNPIGYSGLKITNKSGGNINRNGTSNQTISTTFRNDAGGTVTVNSGVGLVFNDSLSNAGAFVGDGLVQIDGGGHLFEGGTFGDGTGTLNITGAVNITSPTGFTPNFSVINHLNGSTLTGLGSPLMTIPTGVTYNGQNTHTITGFANVTNEGTMELIQSIGGVQTHRLESDITNNGTFTWTSGTLIGRADTTYLTNTGLLNKAVVSTSTNFCVNGNGSINITGSALACLFPEPEIDVQGGVASNSISNGDNTPSTIDDTDFGSFPITTNHTHTFTILNTGSGDLTLGTVTIDNTADFTIISQPAGTVASGGSTTFDVTFAASVAGIRTGVLSIPNDDPDEAPYTFTLQGTGLGEPEIDVRGGSPLVSIVNGDNTPSITDDTDFGDQVIGIDHVHVFPIFNVGTSNLNLGTITIDNTTDFTISQVSNTVGPNGATNLTVTFSASTVGQKDAIITIPSDDPDEDPFTFSITGNAALYNSPGFVMGITTTGNNQSFTIPTDGGGYSYDVDWGDGNTSSTQTGDATHTYSTAGTYYVAITGTFPRIFFNNTGSSKDRVTSIEQWGNIAWTSFLDAFNGCSALEYNATDAPDFSNVTDLENMFKDCISFNATDLTSWNTASITNLSHIFDGCTVFNGDVSSWNTANVTDMSAVFRATDFNGVVSNWDVSSVQDMYQMFAFSPFNRSLSNWERTGSTLANVWGFGEMFFGNVFFNRDINNWNTSGATAMYGTFCDATAFSFSLDNWNTSSVTTMDQMFRSAESFNYHLGDWDISSVQSMDNMLSFSGIDTMNYDSTLIFWSQQTVQPNVNLGAYDLRYCDAETERNILLSSPNDWIIEGDVRDCGVVANAPAAVVPAGTYRPSSVFESTATIQSSPTQTVVFFAPPEFGWTFGPGFFCPANFYARINNYSIPLFSVDGSDNNEIQYTTEEVKATDDEMESNDDDENTTVFANSLDVSPNPFKDHTNISYTVGEASIINLGLYDLNGNKVVSLVRNAKRDAGNYSARLDASNLARGTYVVLLRTEKSLIHQRVIIVD
ncbi:MAG: BspA family leucine-rich repeat surface protein, partial [Bacteroidota bacterium]